MKTQSTTATVKMDDAASMAQFAADVLTTAKGIAAAGDKRSFHGKVFIAAIADAMGVQVAALGEFLIAANRDCLLELSRADLVQAMDATMVARSEVTYLNGRFHFVRTEK